MSGSLINYSPTPLKRLFDYIAPHKKRLWIAVFYSFINKILDLAPPVLVQIGVDTVSGNTPWIVKYVADDSALIAGLFIGSAGFFIFCFESFFQWLFTLRFMNLAQDVQHELRVDTYKALQEREMRFFEDHRLGETMSIVNDDINQMERFLNTVFNDIVQLVSLVIISSFILYFTSPQLGLIAILPIPLIVWGSLKFQKLLAPKYVKVRDVVGKLNTRLENNISGIAVIKSFVAERYEAERICKVSDDYRVSNQSAISYSALFTPLIRIGVAFGFAPMLVIGVVWTIEGKITPGVFTLFAMMVQRILWPFTGLGRLLDEVERCRASSARVFGLLDTPPKILSKAEPQELSGRKGEIDFDNVSFSYPRGNRIINGLSLNIKDGETIGVAGTTGAGKSTLLKLLLRFYEPTSGQIKINGINIADLSIPNLREHIALVSQDVYVFDGTIGDNIRYGNFSASEERVVDAAKKAQLDEFINSLPAKYNTVVGERGIKLSGGQRQRLSIARALLKDAPILILDEATSSVDTETEKAIQEGIEVYTKGKTAIIIAHRLSTIRSADRILVLSQGQIAEEGTHNELIANKGLYRELWAVQSGMKGHE